VILALSGVAFGLELSTVVLPSADEALEALESGEISYHQYLQLCEIINYGIDSTTSYLLDEIPNLVYVGESDQPLSDPSETEQLQAVGGEAMATGGNNPITGHLGYRFYQQLDETERTWYRTSGNLLVADQFRVRFDIERSKSGRERVVRRSLGYSAPIGTVRHLVVGSFTARLGLGTMFGYAGKRLDYADRLSAESWLFPDYGGYNGVLVDARTGRLKMTGLVSIQRNAQFRLVSTGLMTQLEGHSA
jgi:hypothetical protein